jgi:dihydroxy-acid dehydratase
MNKPLTGVTRRKLRSSEWFNNPHNPGMTALYLERYLNYGLTRQELQAGKPIIGIAQTGNDLSPCNRHHLELAHRVREGIRAAGGIAMEFPMHPIQETGKRPTAALDRNLAYLGLVEILFGYPLDGVVLTTGCDKTTPACLMAAATVNMPAIVLSGGPMLNGWHNGERSGSGTVVWKARERLAAGEIDYEEFMNIVASSAPSVGHCNTMGTASTMNSLAEALGMSLPGCAAIPAPYRERGQIAYETGGADRRHGLGGSEAVRHPDPGRRSRTASWSIRRSAARPMRRSISTRWPAISASNSRSRTGRNTAIIFRCW